MIKSSELVLNSDGSIYHINLKRENLATTIFLVGDPNRVEVVSKHFDRIDFKTQKREFVTHTGEYKGQRVSVISTGIGPDNIDIVLNELDAVHNINFQTRERESTHTTLRIVRLGTSGSLQEDIPVDSIVLSTHGLGLDNLLHYYRDAQQVREITMEEAFIVHTSWNLLKGRPYVVQGSTSLLEQMYSPSVFKGITGTAPGFYGPQGRELRLAVEDAQVVNKFHSFNFEGYRFTNLEMETSAIYGLSKLLGHQALSMNAIIAGRAVGAFSQNPKKAVENLIAYALNRLFY